MNHAARHLCINSAQYTLANTNNRRINNKLDTRAYTQAASCCVGTKNGLEMKPNQTKVTNKNATPQTSQHQTHRSGFRVRDPVPVQRERLEGVGGSNLFGERKKKVNR